MPISATTALASFALALEAQVGYQNLMPPTNLALSMPLTVQPSGTSGMRLLFYMSNYTLGANLANGITVVGNTLAANGVTEQITVLPTVMGQNSQIVDFEYLTVNAFTSVTSISVNNALVSGGGQLATKGVIAAKYLIPCDFKAKGPKYDTHSANEKRASMARHFNILQLVKKVAVDGFDSVAYPNTSLYFFLMLLNANPTIVPLNTSTVSLKTTATASPITLTTPPSNTPPGLQLQFLVSGASTSGTIAAAGQDVLGNNLYELLTCSGNGTYQTTGFFFNVSSIVIVGLTGYSINVNGLGATTLKGATAPTSNPQTFSTFNAPVAPGQTLQAVVTGNAAAATLTVVGKNLFGQLISEIMTIPAAAASIVYSQNKFSSVSSITSTLATTTTFTVNGVQGFVWTFLPGNSVYSASGEEYTGADTVAYPFIFLDEGDIEFEADKEVKLTAKGMAQDYLPIGDRSAGSILASTRATQLGQPTDLPMVGPDALLYLDPISGQPLGTLYADGYSVKLSIKRPQDPKFTISNKQTFDRVYSKKREFMLALKLDFTTETQAEKYRQNQKQYFGSIINGSTIGGGYSNSWTLIMPCRYMKYDKTVGVDAASIDVDADLTGEYDATLGAEFKVTVICEVPPSYVS